MIFHHSVYRYVDYAVTDILQMVGQANRPVLDTNGMCVYLTYDHIYLCVVYVYIHICIPYSG